jgi:hypothetical protein
VNIGSARDGASNLLEDDVLKPVRDHVPPDAAGLGPVRPARRPLLVRRGASDFIWRD